MFIGDTAWTERTQEWWGTEFRNYAAWSRINQRYISQNACAIVRMKMRVYARQLEAIFILFRLIHFISLPQKRIVWKVEWGWHDNYEICLCFHNPATCKSWGVLPQQQRIGTRKCHFAIQLLSCKIANNLSLLWASLASPLQHGIVLIPIRFPFVSFSLWFGLGRKFGMGGRREGNDLHRSREYSMKSGRQTAHHENDERAGIHVDLKFQ